MARLGYPASFDTSVAESAVFAFRRNQMVAEDENEAFANEMARTEFDANGESVHTAIETLAEEVSDIEDSNG